MASTEATETTRAQFPNLVGPLTSAKWCYLLAAAFGVACGVVVFLLWKLFALPDSLPLWLAVGATAFGMAGVFMDNCHKPVIPIGSVGVPTLSGNPFRYPKDADQGMQLQERNAHGGMTSLRTRFHLLSPGLHTLPPFMRAQEVDVRLDTSPEFQVESISRGETDNTDPNAPLGVSGPLMTASVTFEREVINPILWLNTVKPDDSIYGIAKMVVENVFPCFGVAQLQEEGTRDEICCRIKEEIDKHDFQYGLNVTKVFMSAIKPPQAILDAYARIQIEVAEAEAEKTEWDNVRKRIKEMVDQDGIDAHRAFEYFQAERGKAQAVRNTHRLEGLEPVLQLLGELVRERKQKPRRRQT